MTAAAAPDGPVAVISHRFWREHFAGADDVVGRQITLQRRAFTVVGVMPPGFFGVDVGRMTDVMLPFAAEPLMRGQESWLAAVDLVVAQHDGAAEARAEPRAGECRAPRRAAADPRRDHERYGGSKSRALSHPSIDPGARRDRQVVAAHTIRNAALRDDRGRGAPAARRLHEHRQPAGRARAGAAPRAQREDGAWRFARAARAAALHREPDRGDGRCGARTGLRALERRAPGPPVEHVGERRIAGARARLARARIQRGARLRVSDCRRRRARARIEERCRR